MDDFFAHVPATFWTTDTSLALTFVRGSLLRTLGIAPEQLLGRTLPDILLEGRVDHPFVQGHLTALSGHETSVRIEWAGKVHSARIAPLRDRGGQIVGCVGVQQPIESIPDDVDFTMRESEIRLQRVIDYCPIGLAFGDDQGHISDANDAFLRMTGHSREDLVPDGLSWPSLTAVEYHQRQLESIEEIAATGRSSPFETEIIRTDGRRVPVQVSAARLSARRREGVAFVVDLSPYKRVERHLRAELAAADALAAAPSPRDAVDGIAACLVAQVGWAGAAIWRHANGALEPGQQRGVARLDRALVERMVARAMASGETAWAEAPGIFVVPLGVNENRVGAMALSWTPGSSPTEDVIATTGAIARRLAKYLAGKDA